MGETCLSWPTAWGMWLTILTGHVNIIASNWCLPCFIWVEVWAVHLLDDLRAVAHNAMSPTFCNGFNAFLWTSVTSMIHQKQINQSEEAEKHWNFCSQLYVSLNKLTKPSSAAIVSKLHHFLFLFFFNSHLLCSWMQTDSTVQGSTCIKAYVRMQLSGDVTLSLTTGVSRAWVPTLSPYSQTNTLIKSCILSSAWQIACITIMVTYFKSLTLTHLNSHLEFGSQIHQWTKSIRWMENWNQQSIK